MPDPSAAPVQSSSGPNLYGMEREDLAAALSSLTPRPFHADQIFHWMYGRGMTDPAAMTDLPAPLRRSLCDRFRIVWPEIRGTRDSADGPRKYLLGLEDGGAIETVFMPYRDRITLCLSSQIGCGLACRFCLTGTMGLVRNLRPGEIVGQVAVAARDRGFDPRGARLVFMGMGEPLQNYESVMQAFRILIDGKGFAIPPRRITLSTAGLVPGIDRLAGASPRPRLAVSLTAARDDLRNDLVPINRRHGLDRLLAACRRFPLRPRESITFEYILLAGINDAPDEAARLARLIRGIRAKVNVIPYNEAGVDEFRTPSKEEAARFRDALLARGVPASIRWSKGRDIGAACGQLAGQDDRAARRTTP